MNATRTLAAAGLWGAALTVVILAMSVLLRLGTQMDGGNAISTLPAGVETWARVAHRVAAMGVGVLAVLAFVAMWRGESPPRPSAWPVGAVVVLTVVLATVGRYTPGYRADLVTVVNVAGGVALVAAFWALRPRVRAPGADPVALGALALLLLLAGLGAAADAAAMRGARAYGPLHLWLAAIFGCLALAAAWRQRRQRATAIATAVLTLAQFALGLTLVASAELRPLALGWVHAMVACALALLLVSLAARGGEGSRA